MPKHLPTSPRARPSGSRRGLQEHRRVSVHSIVDQSEASNEEDDQDDDNLFVEGEDGKEDGREDGRDEEEEEEEEDEEDEATAAAYNAAYRFLAWAREGFADREAIRQVNVNDPDQCPPVLAEWVAEIGKLVDPKKKDKSGKKSQSRKKRKNEGGESDIEGEGDPDESNGEPARKKPKNNQSTQHRWGAITTAQSFEAPASITRHLEIYGVGPVEFITERVGAKVVEAELPPHQDHWRRRLAVRWDYLDSVDKRLDGLDPARRLAHYLMIRDLVRLIDPKASTRRPTKRTWQALRTLLDHISQGRTCISRSEAAKQLWERFKYGEKVFHLNREFGAGAAFILAKKLSPDFLRSKSPPSEFREQAYRRLAQDLEFVHDAKHGQIAELATNVREFLIRPLREAYAQLGVSSTRPLPDDIDVDLTDDYPSGEMRKIDALALRQMLRQTDGEDADEQEVHVRRRKDGRRGARDAEGVDVKPEAPIQTPASSGIGGFIRGYFSRGK